MTRVKVRVVEANVLGIKHHTNQYGTKIVPMHLGKKAIRNYYVCSLSDKQLNDTFTAKENGKSITYSYNLPIREYNKVYDSIAEHIKEEMFNGCRVNLGRIGNICIVAHRRIIKLDKEGKLRKKYMPIDWGKTKALWKELYPDLPKVMVKNWDYTYKFIKNKPLIYYDQKYIFDVDIFFNRNRIRPTGLRYIQYQINDSFKNDMAKRIRELDEDCLRVAAVVNENPEYLIEYKQKKKKYVYRNRKC